MGSITPAIYLDRLPIQVINTRSVKECFRLCLHQAGCVSSNYLLGVERRFNLCVLNAAMVEEYYAVGQDERGTSYYRVDAQYWIYIHIGQINTQ